MIKNYVLLISLFFFINNISGQEILLLKSSGKVVIGDTTQIETPGNYNLYVQNGILTEKVKVSLKNTADWSDDSFISTPCISDVEKSIIEDSHLINMPSASEVVKYGYEVTNMDAKLLEQIEWLWQYTIQLNKENEKLKERILLLESKNK